jgi:hypothetical protein
LVVASLEETQGLLSRFDSVYLGYITQGGAGGALAVAMSLRARCFFFPTHDRQTEEEREEKEREKSLSKSGQQAVRVGDRCFVSRYV